MKAEPIGEIVLRLTVQEAKALFEDAAMFAQVGPQNCRENGYDSPLSTRKLMTRFSKALEEAVNGRIFEGP